MTTDLIAFIRARLDEDAVVAGAASVPSAAAHWSLDEWFGREQPHSLIAVGSARHPTAFGHFTADPVPTLQAQHIARHDPARVLAEVDAKQKIVDLMAKLLDAAEGDSEVDHYGGLSAAEESLGLLALPFAGHPDYREEWRP